MKFQELIEYFRARYPGLDWLDDVEFAIKIRSFLINRKLLPVEELTEREKEELQLLPILEEYLV